MKKTILFAIITLLTNSAHSATKRTGAYQMPLGCVLDINIRFDEISMKPRPYLGFKCPGKPQSAEAEYFQSALVFPGTEAVIAERICRKLGSPLGVAPRFTVGGWGAETSVLVIDTNLDVFTYEDSTGDLVVFGSLECQ